MAPKRTQQTILVIDDDQEFRNTISDILFNYGYEVMTAGDGLMAMRLLLNSYKHIDLVISDIKMPGLDGFSLLNQMFEDTDLRDIPVLLVSAENDKNLPQESFKNGAIEFLNKSFEISDLIELTKNIFDNENKASSVSNNIKIHKGFRSIGETLQDTSYIISHSIRHANSTIHQAIHLHQSDELDTKKALSIIQSMSNEIEKTIQQINKLIDNNMDTIDAKKINSRLDHIDEVWFIDDDPLVNTLHSIMIEKFLNQKAQIFSDAESALDLIKNDQIPDLVFLDLNMPGISGFDFLDILGTKQLNIPVIILTSSLQQTDKMQSFSYSNVVDYQTKPLKKEMLMLINSKG